MSSIFGSNPISGKVHRSKSSMYGKLEINPGKCTNSEDLLKQLYTNVGSLLNDLLQNYSVGNFIGVRNELTRDRYNQLTVTFRNNSKPDFLYYEIIRLLFSKILDGLMQSVNQYVNLLDTISRLNTCNEYKSILDDPEKLKKYIEELRGRRYLFDIEPISMIKATIRQEYVEYIKLHGFPPSGIFDGSKLGDIIYKLENNIPIDYNLPGSSNS
jgi:hypothetical protein